LTRKLIALDLLLLAIAALLGIHLRREWLAAQSREHAFLQKKIQPTPAQPLVPFVKPAPLTAAAYAQVAEKNLFSKDRNSNVILDPVAPPPPKPQPPFPVARGVMLWDGMPPTVVLSDRAGGVQKGYHPGDRIGDWEIVSVDNQYLVLGWDGKEFKKRLDELLDKTTLTVAEAPMPLAAPAPAATPAATIQTLSSQRVDGPGVEVSPGLSACQPGDANPPGAVVGGMRKVVTATPFGSACRWEPVK